MTTVGFTGTRHGMTIRQSNALGDVFREHAITELHFGDCLGADEEAAAGAAGLGIKTVAHPPVDNKHRAFFPADMILSVGTYQSRNRSIVDCCDLLVAAPRHFSEDVRSGTWMTIRYARLANRPLIILLPDGHRLAEP